MPPGVQCIRIRLAMPSVTPKSVAENAPRPQFTSKVVWVPGADGSGEMRVGSGCAGIETVSDAADDAGAGPVSTMAASQTVLTQAAAMTALNKRIESPL